MRTTVFEDIQERRCERFSWPLFKIHSGTPSYIAFSMIFWRSGLLKQITPKVLLKRYLDATQSFSGIIVFLANLCSDRKPIHAHTRK